MAFDPTIASQGMKPLFGFVVTERRFSYKFCIKLHICKRIHPEKLGMFLKDRTCDKQTFELVPTIATY